MGDEFRSRCLGGLGKTLWRCDCERCRVRKQFADSLEANPCHGCGELSEPVIFSLALFKPWPVRYRCGSCGVDRGVLDPNLG